MSPTASKQPPPKKARFFLALLPPPQVQAYATELKEYFRDRYSSKAALSSPPHITLQPPFEWPDDECDRLQTTLANFSLQQVSIPIELFRFGSFPPRVIYIAVKSTPELMTLQMHLNQYLKESLDIIHPQSHTRPFCPHLTVAFRDLKTAAFRQAWLEFEQREVQFSFLAHELTLLIHTGSCWEAHTTFHFT